MLFGSCSYGIALELIEFFLREAAGIVTVAAQEWELNVEVSFQESFLFVVLFKELLRESAFFCCKVQYLTVVEMAVELFCKF